MVNKNAKQTNKQNDATSENLVKKRTNVNWKKETLFKLQSSSQKSKGGKIVARL